MRQVSAKTVVLGYVIRITFRSYSNLFVFMILYFEKTVGHAPRAVYVVVARHHRHAARQAYHCLVGQQYLFHQLPLLRLTAAAIAEVVFRAGSHALLQPCCSS